MLHLVLQLVAAWRMTWWNHRGNRSNDLVDSSGRHRKCSQWGSAADLVRDFRCQQVPSHPDGVRRFDRQENVHRLHLQHLRYQSLLFATAYTGTSQPSSGTWIGFSVYALGEAALSQPSTSVFFQTGTCSGKC